MRRAVESAGSAYDSSPTTVGQLADLAGTPIRLSSAAGSAPALDRHLDRMTPSVKYPPAIQCPSIVARMTASGNSALGCLEQTFHPHREGLELVEEIGAKLREDDADRLEKAGGAIHRLYGRRRQLRRRDGRRPVLCRPVGGEFGALQQALEP
jgi:hypothetical protein